MILFFKGSTDKIYAVSTEKDINKTTQEKLIWLFGDAQLISKNALKGHFIGPRKEMVTPWSTNAVEITQNMDIDGIIRVEEFLEVFSPDVKHGPNA